MTSLRRRQTLLYSCPEQDFDHIGNEASGCSHVYESLRCRQAHGSLQREWTSKKGEGMERCSVLSVVGAPGQSGYWCGPTPLESSYPRSSLLRHRYSSNDREKCPEGPSLPHSFFSRKRCANQPSPHTPFFSLLLAGRVEPFQKVHKCQKRFEMKDRREEDLHDPG